jgi:thiol-disulfide isomerase/thioredoxin
MSNNSCQKLFARTFSSLILSLSLVSAFAGTITGKATDHAGREVYLLRYLDPYSLKTEVIQSSTISDDGTFRLVNPENSTQECVIAILNLRARIFMKAQTDYHVTFPVLPADIPYTFKPIWLEFEFTGMKQDDPNLAISAFNRSYEQFFDSISVDLAQKMYRGSSSYRTSRKRQLETTNMVSESTDSMLVKNTNVSKAFEEWKKSADSLKQANADVYTKTYLSYGKYRIELYLGKPKQELIEKHIQSPNFDPFHPECASFLEETFAFYFHKDYFHTDYDSLVHAIHLTDSRTIQNLIGSNAKVSNPLIIDLIALSNLRGLYYGVQFSKATIYRNIEMLADSSDSGIEPIALRVLEKLAAGKKGSQPENFTLMNEKSERVQLKDYQGQFVYINFFKSNCSSCAREMQLMEPFQAKFNQQLTILSICMDQSLDDLTNYLSKHPDQKWEFLFGGSHPDLADQFNLRSIPGYYLLNPNGQLVYTYTKSPSEGISDQIYSLLNSFAPDQRIKVWDD